MPGIAEKAVQGTLPKLWATELDEAAVSAGWSTSGGWLAAASASGGIYLFEALTGSKTKGWSGHRIGANVVAWNPKEDLLAIG